MLVGSGTPERLSEIKSPEPNVIQSLPIVAGSVGDAALEGAYAYIIPTTVGKWLNKTDPSKPSKILAYSDILEMIIGVQKFSNNTSDNTNPSKIFLPDGTTDKKGQRSTPYPILGKFLPAMPQFANNTIWNLLSTFVNPAVNEMFITLKVNGDNQIVPTLIIRQLPFTSDLLEETDFKLTRFLDVPRWKIPNQVINAVSMGRSESTRFNFVHLVADSFATVANGQQLSLLLNPPALDQADVRRNGLRMSDSTIPCAPTDIKNEPKKWIKMKSDILMGMQLTLTGTLTCDGIQQPIAPGDNIEFDGAVFHIESVSHSCSFNGPTKTFQTVLSLTFGVRDRNQSVDPSLGEDLGKFEGIQDSDLTTNDPGFTVDTSQSRG
jgi:hypothetical protein